MAPLWHLLFVSKAARVTEICNFNLHPKVQAGSFALPQYPRSYTSLNTALLILYSAILAEMLRRDRPQILAQRPMLPRLFLRALRMYCCSISALRVCSIVQAS